ncbi:MAG: Crp/Fnr family transcriptional regulator [Ilyomonas sp.]
MDLTSINALKKVCAAIYPLEEEVWEEFSSIWKPFSAKRKTVLTAAGETEKYLYFVVEGVQRAYSIHLEKEATIMFSYPFSFSGNIDSFLLQQPSIFYFETLTQSNFIRTTFYQVDALLNRYPDFEKFVRISLCRTFAGTLQRMIELQAFSAEEKFRTLLKRSPHVLQLIPHKYLASYLALDATTFSKLLSSVRI